MVLIYNICLPKIREGQQKNTAGSLGNTPCNTINNGLFYEKDHTIYFSNWADQNHLYKMNSDGSHIEKINDDSVSFLNGSKNFLYYIKTNTASNSRENFFAFAQYGIIKMKYKNEKTSTVDNHVTKSMCLYGNDLLYQSYDKKTGITLTHMNIVKEKSTALTKDNVVPTSFGSDVFYYFNPLNQNIYQSDFNYKHQMAVYEGSAYNPVRMGNYIYFLDISNNYALERIDLTNANEATTLTSERCSTFNVTKDYIFYQVDDKENSGLKRMDLSGDNVVLIKPGNYRNLNVTSNFLFFQEFGTSNGYYIKLKDSTPTVQAFAPKASKKIVKK